MNGRAFASRLGSGVALVVAIWLASSPVAAQSRQTIRAVQRFGQMDGATARRVVQSVHERLRGNAQRGPDRYDPLRQVVGVGLFGGPGDTRTEYNRRLAEVVGRLSRGLDAANLRLLFMPGPGVAMRCARFFSLPIGACDALSAAASEQAVDFPYLAPDDGRAFRGDLLQSGVSPAEADAVLTGLRRLLFGVPASLDATPRGQRITGLLQSCPGGLPDAESRVRAWHLGPTSGLARCVGRALGRSGRSAPNAVSELLGVPAAGAATTFLRWAHGQAARSAAPPPPRPPSRDQIMRQAMTHYRGRRFREAAEAYGRVATMEPSFAPALQGLAVSLMQAGDAAGAVRAYRSAARIRPTDAALQVGLGRALVQAGDREGAFHAYQLALALEPGRQDAQREIAALGRGAAAAPPAPSRVVPRRRPPQPAPNRAVVDADQLRTVARGHYSARRFAAAETAYRELTALRASDAAAWAGLAASQLAQNKAAEALASYGRAVSLDGSRAGYLAGRGAAEMASGDRDAARASFQSALRLDPNHAGARQGLERLGPEGPSLPETPDRGDIVRGLARFQQPIQECAPEASGTWSFRIVIAGEDGSVQDVRLVGPHARSAEGPCMVEHLRGARFPRFTRPTLQVVYPFELEGQPAEPEAPAEEPSEEEEPPHGHHVNDIVNDVLGDE